MNIEELHRIADRIRDQDNLCTAHICFCVQKLNVLVGIDAGLVDDEIAWVHQGDLMASDDWPRISEAYDKDEQTVTIDGDIYKVSDFERYGYRESWETVQVCFTREGAERYIAANGHNISKYGAPRIYGESFHRNSEMIALREIIPFMSDFIKGKISP